MGGGRYLSSLLVLIVLSFIACSTSQSNTDVVIHAKTGKIRVGVKKILHHKTKRKIMRKGKSLFGLKIRWVGQK